MKIANDLHGFLWSDWRANNANTYLIHRGKNILITPDMDIFSNMFQAALRTLRSGRATWILLSRPISIT